MNIGAAVAASALTLGLLAAPASAAEACDGNPANPACPVMDAATAGSVYLEFMCPANAAVSRFSDLVDRRSEGYFGRHPKADTRKAAKRVQQKLTRLADEFEDGYTYRGFWPDSVKSDIAGIAGTARWNAETARLISKKSHRWSEDDEFGEYGYQADNVRWALGLPPRGEDDGC